VLCYNLKRVGNILGVPTLLQALKPSWGLKEVILCCCKQRRAHQSENPRLFDTACFAGDDTEFVDAPERVLHPYHGPGGSILPVPVLRQFVDEF